MMDIGKKIEKIRESQGLSQNKLAQLSKVSQSALSDIEAGKRSPRYDTLELIAKALGISVAELSGASPPPKSVSPADVSDEDIMFALFGEPAGEITEEMFEEVRDFARYVIDKERRKQQGDNNGAD